MPELDKDLQDSLKEIVKSCEKEDDEIRKAMVRTWKKNEEFWHGVQYLFWSQQDETWRSPLDFGFSDDDTGAMDEIGSFSDKVVDIFRGHGEAIISALAAQIPALRFLPDDADSDIDVITSRTKSKIADLVQRHNKAKLVYLRALFFLALNGIVASYRYKDSDFKYGSYVVPKYDRQKQDVPQYTCEICGYTADQDWTQDQGNNPQQQQPFQYDATSGGVCPQCGSPEPPKVSKTKVDVPVMTGQEELPKTRVKIDVFGPLHFKVSYYARNQSECSYFMLFGDLGKDRVKYTYPDFCDEIDAETLTNMDRFARSEYLNSSGSDLTQNSLVTVVKTWLRPMAFFRENKKNIRERLLKKFPKGCRVTLIGKNKIFVEAVEEDLDSRWEIGQAGLSTYIHSDPILRPLVMIQEMRNQLVNLIMETINHGISSDFADPSVLNFDLYGKFEAVPGYIYQTKAGRPGEPIGNAFYSTSRSILSREVGAFLAQLDKDAQFSIGSFPSVYGGPSEGKSRTFSEYAASRQMALQRLSIIYNLLTDWWLRTLSGCVDLYVENIVEDEKFTKFENGSYINVWIKLSELQGKTGGVEPEASETFPVSLAQKKDLIMKLMELNNPFINNALYLPENARVIQDVMALNEFKLPGEAQRVKQCIEINELLKEAPLNPLMSTIPPEEGVDDDAVHSATCQSFLVDTVGLDAKRTNPEGYANVLAHKQQHDMALLKKTLTSAPGAPAPGQAPPSADPGIEE